MDIKELNIAGLNLDSFVGLSHIGNGKNQDIEKYYQSFQTWLDWNNVIDVVNNYKNIHMDLHYVTSHDFLVWLLHYGDIYDNLLRHCLNQNPSMDYKTAARDLYKLRESHPKFSFTVALAAHFDAHDFLSDKDLDQFIPVLANIPNNSSKKKDQMIVSELGEKLYEAIYSLSNFAVERVSQECF
ncbi:hypothetical protein [Companilactobacillus pabuli]|jgi:hypothetical protein|uniref:Uncharacterized protein n=1 Tax=Companilactobacillus pabuli TaxID=2714036 RepID=A0A7L7KWH0_9LACO|nr:hypothetical protein [Companilactobacillus pabuli]AKP03823.1 hypothetical protein ABB45_09465 [Companilactobacillus farciminis]AKS52128.1 hypothetical protein ABB44_09485 [Companilactobacillus farciminis]MDG5113048.1 hypothetical protein [Companilactobacillus pabuli]QMT84127.1 hypothetical protein G6534_05595 [Companilactobacillus pabuli]